MPVLRVFNKISTMANLVSVFLLAVAVQGQNYDSLENLGSRITSRVQAELAPLQGLGDRINAQVQHNLAGLENLGSRITSRVQAELAPLQGLGDRINAQVQHNIAGMEVNLNSRLSNLDGLGNEISQSVYDGLEPVRAIELNFKMRDGVGGSTIVTHQPGGRQFIIKNYNLFTCSSQIDVETGICKGTLTPYKISSSSPRTDWCYVTSTARNNNNICLSASPLSVQIFNNQMKCETFDNSPIFQTTLDEYKKLCSDVRQTTEVRYIPDLNDPRHVEIPNSNKYVKCENQQKNLCIFHETNSFLNDQNSNVYINQRAGSTSVFSASY